MDSNFTMVYVVEKCWLDLKWIKREIKTTVLISQMKQLLSSTQKREWYLQLHRVKARKMHLRFLKFFQFLLEEKQVI